MLQILSLGNLRVSPSGLPAQWGIFDAELDPNIIVTTGDIVEADADHQSGNSFCRKALTVGIEFYKRLQFVFNCPILAVPGQIDPPPLLQAIVDEVDSVRFLYNESISTAELATDSITDDVSLIGWGGKRSDADRLHQYLDSISLAVGSEGSTTQCASKRAHQLEETVADYILGKTTPKQVALKLLLPKSMRAQFISDVKEFRQKYSILKSCIANTESIPILYTRQTPYYSGVENGFNNQKIHSGSLILKLAVLSTNVDLVIGGHSHPSRQDLITEGRSCTHVVHHPDSGCTSIDYTPKLPPEVSYPDMRTDH